MKRAVVFCYLLLALLAVADEKGTIRYFNSIKSNPVELAAFCRMMPKGADLHNHLSGAIYGEEWLDVAEEAGVLYDTAANVLTMTKGATAITLAQMKQNGDYYQKWLDRVSMRSWTPYSFNGHDHFFATFGYFLPSGVEVSDAALLAYAVKRAEMQNIRLLELMDLPIGDAWSVLSDRPNTTDFATLLKYVQSKAPEFVQKARAALDKVSADAAKILGYQYPLGDRRNPVYTRYIGAVNRNGTLTGMTVVLAATCELMKVDNRFVGLQILAPEDWPTARRDFRKQMAIFDQIYKAYNRPNIALHCGELNLLIAPFEDCTFHIRESIATGHAKRVGHAIDLQWEDDMVGLLKIMKEQKICVETCPTSEWMICSVKGDNHPIKTYLKHGVPVCINTDDEGVQRTNLSQEYARSVEWWEFDYKTLKELSKNSIRYMFSEGKDEELKRLDQAFKEFEKRYD